jgi:hypothetical protein
VRDQRGKSDRSEGVFGVRHQSEGVLRAVHKSELLSQPESYKNGRSRWGCGQEGEDGGVG